MKILNFGSMNLDYVYTLDRIVTRGETAMARQLKTVPGGKGLNQSIALARAGAKAWHAGCCGRGGEELTKLLSDNGVNVSHITPVEAPQGNAIIQVEESGDNSIIVFGGSNRCLDKDRIDAALAECGAGDLVILQNEINRIDYILHEAHRRGLVTVLNPSPFNEAIDGCDLNDLSWIIMNETETRELTGTDDAEKAWAILHEKYPHLKAVITLGTDGAWCFDGDKAVFQSAFKVNAVDTTAAGDTFTGYFFALLTEGAPIEQAMRTAAMASAISVTVPGASVSIPDRKTVDRALEALE